MQASLMRRFVAAFAISALILTLGVQGAHAAFMATMKSEMSLSMASPSDAAFGKCANCDNSGKSAVVQCQAVCALSVAVLPDSKPVLCVSQPARFEAENVTFDGRTGTPEPHPPKSFALL
jgi:hypothetical protein